MKHYFILLFLGIGLLGFAQQSDSLSVNNIEAHFTSNGGLFQNGSSTNFTNQFKIKDANGKSTVSAGALWIGGYQNGSLKLAAQKYYGPNANLKTDFAAGPMCTNSSRYQDSSYTQTYDRLWRVTRNEIQTHQSDYQNANYVTPESILFWPAHGNTQKGESKFLAPFADHNNNRIYEPALGEHPEIRGDQALFMMFNDDNRSDALTFTGKLGVEVHLMAYAFDSIQDTALHNTIFLNYQIYNRSSNDLDSLIVAHWTDFDIGNALDDFIGSDSALGLTYSFNGDTDDDGPNGFGLYPPAMGFMSLGNDLAGSGYYNQGNGAPIATREPSGSLDYYNYMKQLWKNESPMVIEPNGDGYSTNPSSFSKTRWIFGNNKWGNLPFHNFNTHCNIVSHPTQNLKAGSYFCLDAAYVYARNLNSIYLFASLNEVFKHSNSVKQFFTAQPFACHIPNISIEESILNSRASIYVYPNPTSNELTVEADFEMQEIHIFDFSGKKVFTQTFVDRKKLSLALGNQLTPGLYVLKVLGKNQETSSFKVLLE